MSDLEELLLAQIRAAGLPEPEREVQLIPTRRWRWDFVWPGKYAAAEIQGGTWSQGRHTRGDGFTNDCQKANALELDGWLSLRFTREMIESGEAIKVLREALK
jgi:hypothetical protein